MVAVLFSCKRYCLFYGKKKKTFSCADCTKCFGHASSLKTHIKIVHEKKTYTCSQCGKALRSAHNLSAHVQTVHEKQKSLFDEHVAKDECNSEMTDPIKCDACDQTFTGTQYFFQHYRYIHGKNLEKYSNCLIYPQKQNIIGFLGFH